MESAKLRKQPSKADILGMMLIKLWQMKKIPEQEVMDKIVWPRKASSGKINKGRERTKYLRKLIKEMKEYESTFPGHLEQMLSEAEKELNKTEQSID